MSPQDDVPEQHIPAWKKLGLKLKYAQEKNSDSITTNHLDIVNEKKRKRSLEKNALSPDGSVKNLKKTKVDALGSAFDDSNSDTFQPSREGLRPLPDQATPSRPGGTRKSVSFTPDTKKTDGDSVKQLYQTWLDSHVGKDPSFDPSTFNPAPQVMTSHTVPPSPTLLTQSTTTTKKTKKSKRAKKRSKTSQQCKSQGAQEISPSPHQTTLDYLLTYQISRSSWKFSKSRQTYLLRHLFSSGFIPASHELALQAYLSGLRGAGAKNRLRTAARKVQAADSHITESQDLDEKAEAHKAEEDSAREKQSHTERDLKMKEEKKRKEEDDEEKENKQEDVISKPDFQNTIPARRIADLVLGIIGNNDDDDDDDDDDGEEEKAVKKEEKQQNAKPKPNSKNRHEQKSQPDTTNNTTTHPHPQKRKRIRKHKARVPPSDDDDDDEDDESSSSSSDSGDSGDSGGDKST